MLLNSLPLGPEIAELLARAMFPDPARIARTLSEYRQRSDWQVFAWQHHGLVVCSAGLRIAGPQAELLHIGTSPLEARKGHARSLLEAVISELKLTRLVAETDDAAVVFYQRCGFEVQAIPNKWGTPRYRCVLHRKPPECPTLPPPRTPPG